MKRQQVMIDGNEAVAYTSYRLSFSYLYFWEFADAGQPRHFNLGRPNVIE